MSKKGIRPKKWCSVSVPQEKYDVWQAYAREQGLTVAMMIRKSVDARVNASKFRKS